MQAIDTNVVVRLVLGDDPVQVRLAVECWRAALAEGDVYLSQIALVELSWVLGFSARLSRARIVTELRRLTAIAGVVVENESVVIQAIECYEQSSADFADCLILAKAREVDALPLHTFDRSFSRESGVQLITPR